MKSKLLTILAVPAVLILTGCPTTPQKTNGSPFRESSGGIVWHEATGRQFPPTVGGFTRVDVRKYDATGLDVSAGYHSATASPPIVATLYVYPASPVHSFGSPADVIVGAKRTLARQEFDRRKAEILQFHPTARLVGTKEIDPPVAGRWIGGYFAKFTLTEEFEGKLRPLESQLYIYCYIDDRWTIAYRFTYPAGISAEPTVDQFLSALRKL